MGQESDLIRDLRSLRLKVRSLKSSLLADLRAFQKKKDDLSFFTLPLLSLSNRQGISTASTCTALMALADSNELEKLAPERSSDQVEDVSRDSRESNGQADAVAGQPLKPAKELFQRLVAESWKSSGLRDLNAFTACMVVRAFGFLVEAKVLATKDAIEFRHERVSEKSPEDANEKEEIEKALDELGLGEKSALSLSEIIDAIASRVPRTFSVRRYPPKSTMAYWFVDGVARAKFDIKDRWAKIRDWAVEEFDRQLRYIAAADESVMDPPALAMAACVISRLQKTFQDRSELSEYGLKLPSRVQLRHAIRAVFNKQTDSGIWHKYFPLFHFPKTGAADYTFSFEFLEAVLIEFRDDILSDLDILEPVKRAVRWCDTHRLTFHQGEETFSGWNAGGDIGNLEAGLPEAWATGAVHMCLWELDLTISFWLQNLVLAKFPRRERPSKDKWNQLIDVDIKIPPDGHAMLKDIAKEHLITPATGKRWQTLQKNPLNERRSALLFGPPGTSKTSFARAIAGQLGWPLIIITPSEFLSNGLEQIYVRATEIFDDLMDLSQVIILFDEMDALAQKRDNSAALDVTRQLLTTSMLPKLADLYDRSRVIFLMATNHKKDMDVAITRPGRFDLLLCVGPPSWNKKLEGLKYALKGLQVGDLSAVQTLLKKYSGEVGKQLDSFTVGDFRSFVESIMRRKEKDTVLAALQDIDERTFKELANGWAANYSTLSAEDLRVEYELDREASRIQ